MSRHIIGARKDLRSDQGARTGDHQGRSANPVIKVHGSLPL
jgi:hypothetical protein